MNNHFFNNHGALSNLINGHASMSFEMAEVDR